MLQFAVFEGRQKNLALLYQLLLGLALVAFSASFPVKAATLSDPAVDAYNLRVGTETFAGMYKFTTNTLLVETAEAITNLGSDVIKLYMGNNTSAQSGVTLPGSVTNLITLARDEPSYHRVLDMPFRNFIIWAYPLENSDEWWGSGYNTTQGAKDYNEMYALTRYLLTNYNNSGKTFYLGHWEGDGYLKVNNWSTNPNPATIQGMIGWLNNRQMAVDDAKKATTYTNVNVFNYAEANRVRDAMLNGPTNNQRVINMVVPYVTNLDYLSYSSYDAQNLSATDLYSTLNYMKSMLPTNKADVVPGVRMWIGEYGWGTQSTAAQEPLNRAYIQRLLGWNSGGQCLQYILFWEMYSNYNPGGGTNYCLIDYQTNKVASWYLQHYYFNQARLLAAQFKQAHGRLPTDTEFSSLVTPVLNSPLQTPVHLTVANGGVSVISSNAATLSGTLAQGVYGDDQASVWVFWGTQNGGTARDSWEQRLNLGLNTNFSVASFTATLTNLVSSTNYYFRFYATNSSGESWSPVSTQFSTETVSPGDYGSRLHIGFSGFGGTGTLTDFCALVVLNTNIPGFSYHRFASPVGADLRFTDDGGVQPIPHEIDEWNTNGNSFVWVRVPTLSASSGIWAYWGNPFATNLPSTSTNGSVWLPGADLVWHLKESQFPYGDSAEQYPAVSGVAPLSTNGFIGRGQSFNGSSQYLDAGAINLGQEFTLSAFIKIDSTASNIQTIWASKPAGYSQPGFALYINSYNTSDGELRLETSDGTTGQDAETGPGAVSSNQWHLVTAVVDRLAGTARLYVDGVERTVKSNVQTTFPNAVETYLGRMANGVYSFKGLIDEARIEAGARTSDWVAANWATMAANSGFATYAGTAVQSPSLAIVSSGNSLVATWAANGVGYSLYFTTNLDAPFSWMRALGQPIFSGSVWQVPAVVTNGTVFYRLRSN